MPSVVEIDRIRLRPRGRRARAECDLGRAGPITEGHCGSRMALKRLLKHEFWKCCQTHKAQQACGPGLGGGRNDAAGVNGRLKSQVVLLAQLVRNVGAPGERSFELCGVVA